MILVKEWITSLMQINAWLAEEMFTIIYITMWFSKWVNNFLNANYCLISGGVDNFVKKFRKKPGQVFVV